MADPFRHPRPGAWIGVGLPALLGIAALWLGADSVRADPRDGDGAFGLGLVVSAAVAFWTYPILFRPADDALLRRLGIPARASYWLRAMRLAALALLVVALVLVPHVAAGTVGGTVLAVAGAAAATAWGAALFALAGGARDAVSSEWRPGFWSRRIAFDREMRNAGPLVFAPLVPVVDGIVAARLTVAEPLPAWGVAAAAAIVAALLAAAGARRFERAAPRFSPQAAEMAYAPAPEAGQAGLVSGRGLARLLPARAGAVRARDAAVVARRFRWAGRVAWPVAVVCVLAILRAGERPAVQGWVAGAGAVVLAMQAAAVIGLGRMEREGRRWLDRAAGLAAADRLLGRWAAAFGMALALVVPVGLTWALVLGAGAWMWIGAAGASALVASAASLAAAGR
ncbi:MAG: hypothetical protein KY467_07160 [Gemmatimonadetes bacterium]|nr:hypothetical protein [Gemmatimonadota bacterium]